LQFNVGLNDSEMTNCMWFLLSQYTVCYLASPKLQQIKNELMKSAHQRVGAKLLTLGKQQYFYVGRRLPKDKMTRCYKL